MQPLPGSPRLQAREPRIITRVAGFGEAFCLPCFRRRKRPLSGRENSLLFECNGPLAQPAGDCLNCCETGGGGAAACLERRARSADCTLAAEAAAVAATAAAQDQDPDQITSAAATAATTSAVVMFKTPPLPPPQQQHRIRIRKIILHPLPPFPHPHPQSQPQFVAATSLIISSSIIKFNYTASYEALLARFPCFVKILENFSWYGPCYIV